MDKNRILCPCGSTSTYSACCQPLLSGQAHAQRAEQLMRSRYCAYVHHDSAYLLRTWHPSTRPQNLHFDAASDPQWRDLRIVAIDAGLANDRHGRVEFIARYTLAEQQHQLHENSRFVRENGLWYYVDGDHCDTGRNAPCPCGSGRKYKKCCGA